MIQVTFHNSHNCHSQSDVGRARRAAQDYLDSAGVDASEAYAAHRAEIESGLRGCPLADAWSIAANLAEIAGLEGWSNPDDVFVEISA